jgi:peptide/nickel transport system substrate-binding protein
MKRLAWTIALVFGISDPLHAQEVRNPETFTYAMTGEIDSLDPHWQFDAISQEVSIHLYETLVFYQGASVDKFEPMIASQVPSLENGLLSRDGLTYAFPIRKGVKFHDGTTLTAEDVEYSILRFLMTDRANGSSHVLLEPLLGVESTLAPDGRLDLSLYEKAREAVTIEAGSVVLRLEKPYPPLLSILAGFCPIVSKRWVVAHGGWDGRLETWPKFHNPPKNNEIHDKANGTGPFKLERWDRAAGQLVLSRFDGYWRKAPALRTLVFRTIDDANTRKLMLQAGDADAIMIERQYLSQVEKLPGVVVIDDLPLLEAHNAFVFNFKINPEANVYVGSGKLDGDGIPKDFFADVDVRKGLAFAFDYDAYIRDGYRGKGERARGPIPRGVFGYNPGQAVYAYNLDRAADHLRKAHGGQAWDRGFRFTLTYMEGRADRALACQILKKNVEALNPKFHVDVRAVQWSTWLSDWAARKIPMSNTRWHLDYPDAYNAVYPWLHSNGFYAKTQGYANARADRFIELAKREADRDQRRRQFAELQAIAYQDAPQIYTLDTFHFQVNRSWVKNWSFNPILLYGYLYPVSKERP